MDALRRAEISNVPYLIEDLKPFQDEIVPQLQHSLQEPDLGEKERLRLALALLGLVGAEQGQLTYLCDRLLTAEPGELLVIRAALVPHRDALAAAMWLTAENPATDKDRRFRAYCALAVLDPASPRWTGAGKPAAEALAAENPLLAVTWAEALRPVRKELLPGLLAVFHDRQRALGAVAGDGHPGRLRRRPAAGAGRSADGRRRKAILPACCEAPGARRRVAAVLRSETEKPTPDAAEEVKEALAKRQANAAVALLKTKHADKAWPVLKHSSDPRARSYLIHLLAPLGVDVMVLVRRLREEPDASIRRALILSLGEFDGVQFAAADRKALIDRLLDLYRTDPDPGLHAAADWLLRQKGWDQGSRLSEIDAQLQVDDEHLQHPPIGADKREWYVNTHGQTFAIVKADQPFRMGSPDNEAGRQEHEVPHQQRIDRTFAIASNLVTKAQYGRFQAANPDVFKNDQLNLLVADDAPQLAVNWYDAARYCNWLSQSEGIPKEQWCYEPNVEGKYSKG